MTSFMTIPDYLDTHFVMWQLWAEVIWRHQRSPKRFLIIASHRKEVQKRAWSHRVQIIKTHLMIGIHVDFEVALSSHNLKSTVDLDLMKSSYTYFYAYQWEDLDGAVIFAAARLVQKLLEEKTPLGSSAAILTFFYSCDIINALTQNRPA